MKVLLTNLRLKWFPVAMLLTFEIFECAKNHGKKIPKIEPDLLLVVSSIGQLGRVTYYQQSIKLSLDRNASNPLTLFDMGGGMMAPQNVFAHCAQTLRRRKLKLGDF